ncbi:MAG: hypothetical protein ACIAQF_10140 [Phycisphaerales bacterium JB065]
MNATSSSMYCSPHTNWRVLESVKLALVSGKAQSDRLVLSERISSSRHEAP